MLQKINRKETRSVDQQLNDHKTYQVFSYSTKDEVKGAGVA
jgi:hypothetical protein